MIKPVKATPRELLTYMRATAEAVGLVVPTSRSRMPYKNRHCRVPSVIAASATICCFPFHLQGAAVASDLDVFVSKLRSAYSDVWNPDIEFELEAVLFEPVRLVGSRPLQPQIPVLELSELGFSQEPFRATALYRAWMSGHGESRVERAETDVFSGPDELRWSVDLENKDFVVTSPTLRTRQAQLYDRPGTVDWKNYDFISLNDTLFPGRFVSRLCACIEEFPFQNASVSFDHELMTLTVPQRRMEVTIERKSGTLRSVRVGLLSVAKDVVLEFQGVGSQVFYPAPQPKYVLKCIVDNGSKSERNQSVFRVDVAARNKLTGSARYSWQSIAPAAFRLSTQEVIRTDGTRDERATAVAIRRPAERVDAPRFPTDPPAFNRQLWLAITVCFGVGLGWVIWWRIKRHRPTVER